jgi:hypothetical protein
MLRFSIWLAAIVCLAPALVGFCQEPPLAADKPADEFVRPPLPEIPDEPRTVDPATLVPELLSQRVTVEFKEVSLREVGNWVRENAGVTVVFDTQQFGQNGSLLDTINDKLEDAPLYMLFDRLSLLGLAWYVDDSLVYITSREAAANRKVTRSYSLSDLIDYGYSTTALSEAIESLIPEGKWNLDSGSSDARLGQLEWLADVLFVRQNEHIHRKILGLLESLRQPSRMRFAYDPPQHELLRTALDENISIDFQDTPLIEVVAELAELTRADIRLDEGSLRSLRIRDREPITLTLSDRKLSSVLQVLLTRLRLTWTIDSGVLWVTSQSRAKNNFKIAVFLVDDLCRDEEEMLALFQAVRNQTNGDWTDEEFNTNPEIGFLHGPRVGVMVARQTEPVLREISQLLANYRVALLQSKMRKKPGDDPEEILTRYYRLHSVVANDLSEVLPQLVEPESWKSAESPQAEGEILMRIASSPGKLTVGMSKQDAAGNGSELFEQQYSVLIIRQQRQVHEKIEEVIERIEHGDPRLSLEQLQSGGGGMGGFGGAFFRIAPQAEQLLEPDESDPARPRRSP